MHRLFSFLFLLVSALSIEAQDSTRILSLEEFQKIVLSYHPVAKQAALIKESAKQQLTVARGEFDPKMSAELDRKSFDGKNYYTYLDAQVKVPLWYGMEFKAGYDLAFGSAVNPEYQTSNQGLGYLGISVPLARNLFIDKRMAVLKQAGILQQLSSAEQSRVLNDLMYEASRTYFEWQLERQLLLLADSASRVAERRLLFVKLSCIHGDRPFIDTVEALTQLQLRQYERMQAELNYRNTTLELSAYLWLDGNTPAQITGNILPDTMAIGTQDAYLIKNKLGDLETITLTSHPELLGYQYKLKGLDIERRLKLENLKPAVYANYNLLGKGFNIAPGRDFSNVINNYKAGLSIAFPLTFAQARGEYKMVKLKIQDAGYAMDFKRQQLLVKIRSYYNEYFTLLSQEQLMQDYLYQMKLLLQGEEVRFSNGESSMFLVNSRENKYLETRQKLAETFMKRKKSLVSLLWSAGVFLP